MTRQILVPGYGYVQFKKRGLQVLIPGYGYKSELPPDFVDIVFGAMTQSALASVAMAQPSLSGVALAQSTLADVTLVN